MIVPGGAWITKNGKARLKCVNGKKPTQKISAKCQKNRRWKIEPDSSTFSVTQLCDKKNLLKPNTSSLS
jgi:translation initiation factor IF-1